MYALLLEDTNSLKKGTILKNFKKTDIGIKEKKEIIPYENVLILNENLTSADEVRIKKIIKDYLKLVFWRLYTRNSFVLQ